MAKLRKELQMSRHNYKTQGRNSNLISFAVMACSAFLVGTVYAAYLVPTNSSRSWSDAADGGGGRGFNTSDSRLKLYWKFDGNGNRPVATDISGHGRDGASSNTVCGCVNSNVKAFNGFTANTSYVCITNALGYTWEYEWTFVAWVRNPDWSSTVPHLIARGCKDGNTFGKNSDNAWSLWIDTSGRVRVGLQISGKAYTNDVDAVRTVEWKRDTWYQVALVFGQLNNPHRDETKVYVTEAGAESIGDPVVDWTYETSGYLYGSNALTVGAAEQGWLSVAHPGGCFKGDIRDVSVWSARLSTSDLLSDVQSFNEAWHATDDYATFHWNLDETGETPVAVDATGNGYDGVSINGVQGGFPAPVGTCYGGFKQDVDSLYVNLDSSRYFSDSNRSEVVLWVKKPSPTAANTALLAGNVVEGFDGTSSEKNQSWRVFVEESGAVGILMRDWNSHIDRAVGMPYDWGNGWNLVSIKVDLVSRDHLIGSVNTVDGTVVTNYTAGTCSRIRVYAAPAEKAGHEGDFTLLAECEGSWKGRLAYGKGLVFGHSGPAWQDAFEPASILGKKGRLGEVAFKTGGWFEFDYLRSRLARYYEPPQGLIISVR